MDSSLDIYMPKRIALEGWNYEGLMSREGMFSPCVKYVSIVVFKQLIQHKISIVVYFENPTLSFQL